MKKAEELLSKHLYNHGGDGLGISDGKVYRAVLDALQEALNIPIVSGGLNFEGLTEMKVFADNTGLIIEIEDDEDTCSKHLNIKETKKLADFLNCR